MKFVKGMILGTMVTAGMMMMYNEKMNKNNVMTEYEEKFSSKGNPICKYIIKISES